jgi:hypothetical protein
VFEISPITSLHVCLSVGQGSIVGEASGSLALSSRSVCVCVLFVAAMADAKEQRSEPLLSLPTPLVCLQDEDLVARNRVVRQADKEETTTTGGILPEKEAAAARRRKKKKGTPVGLAKVVRMSMSRRCLLSLCKARQAHRTCLLVILCPDVVLW